MKENLVLNSREVLTYLKEKYELHIITNGFYETQHRKLKKCKLNAYFSQLIISEKLNFKKPSPAIFNYALEQAQAIASESLMIGDDLEVDVMGAAGVGMDQVYFNPYGAKSDDRPTFEISDLRELKNIL